MTTFPMAINCKLIFLFFNMFIKVLQKHAIKVGLIHFFF